jgi:hypothetical protein
VARSRRPVTLDEDDAPRALWERAVGWVIVGVCVVLAVWVLHPSKLLLDTTANGGDMGAHVWWPQFLREHWFTQFRLSGWAPDWYAGFPVGQFYFPLPAVFISILDVVLPYNVAFKLITALGPAMLPPAAYAFARGIRAPWPAPPAFAVAALGMLMQTRTDWQIYGGNIASTLAGEFSFTIGLAFGLFALGALAVTLDTGGRPWLPALLMAAAVLSHIVIAIFVGIAAILLWLVRRPLRTFPLAVAVGAVAAALPAVWLIPLLGQHKYTQSMRYTKLLPRDDWELPSWIWLPGPIKNTIEGVVSGLEFTRPVDSAGKALSPTLWLPWWIWVLGAVAVVAAGWYRRRSTLVLLLLAVTFAVMFVQWPEHAVWNTRFLPFWLLSCGFLAAMGATEICRWVAMAARRAHDWVRDGDLQDARARAWADVARAPDDEVDATQRAEAIEVLASRRFDTSPPGWEPPERLHAETLEKRSRVIATVSLTVVVALVGVFALNRAWNARNGNPAIAISGWANWNYSGYEEKPAWPEYENIMKEMGELPPGRVLWEPSSGNPDAINTYGTSLALELLPYWTDGRIKSMEGLYFESSGTTSFHFLTVAECAENPSNPVRGLDYGTLANDFDRCVDHLQQLGVRYLMLWTPEAQAKANAHDELELVKTIPDRDGQDPKGWKVYEVADSALVEGMRYEPVVADVRGGTYSECWDKEWPDPNTREPEIPGWECSAAAWWGDRELLSKPFAASGPDDWERIDYDDLGDTEMKRITPARVSDVEEDVDKISFRVSEVGKPVVVKTSYFPNWKLEGAQGPYRLAPNMMVVVPTQQDVTLTYGLTGIDWLGRFVTLLGIAGLIFLVFWKGARRYAADPPADADSMGDEPDDDNGGMPPAPNGNDGDEAEPPERTQPAPALP